MDNTKYIRVRGASEHNLKRVDVDIPRGSFAVITGLSGSGKSSLAFDTIYAEGQRRYVESLSAYARQFLDQLGKPEVESIQGLTPTIAIEQRTGQPTPRSTVATSTEVYDYLRVFYARAGLPHCHICDQPIIAQSVADIAQSLLSLPEGTRLHILAPIVRGRKGEHKDKLDTLRKEGFARIRLNGELHRIEEVQVADKNKSNFLEAVVDRVIVSEDAQSRIVDSVETALSLGDGFVMSLSRPPGKNEDQIMLFSEDFSCPEHGPVLTELSPRAFSFNSPFGACPECKGLGALPVPDPTLIIPDPSLSLKEGALAAWKRCGSGLRSFYPRSVAWLAKTFGISVDDPWQSIPAATCKKILYGGKKYEGVIPNLSKRFASTDSPQQKHRIYEFMSLQDCTTCSATRLKPEVLSVRIQDRSIADLTALTINEAKHFFETLNLDAEQTQIAEPIQKAILERLVFLENVGLGYLNLNRATRSLSGGEAQRIRLARQVGSRLAGITYVLDEPTIGLHQRDNERLIATLVALKETGNTVLVVEHDEDVIRQADYLIDMGPGAGEYGGHVVACGTPKQVKRTKTVTASYLKGSQSIAVPKQRHQPQDGHRLRLKNCSLRNFNGVSVDFPLGLFICVTGVSGSGKSTLVNGILHGELQKNLSRGRKRGNTTAHLEGALLIDKVIHVDQSPIGKTSRSNPATYIGVFDRIRSLFALIPEAKARGYQAGRFSFNVKGGRCEACQGKGSKTIEMHFLPDVSVLCEACGGTRYNQETLQIRYKDKNIADVLQMPIADAAPFFQHHPAIYDGLQLLKDVGLGYIRLGQSSKTLSGGEAQRIKLSYELSKRQTGKTLYIMDEPTTGLHFHDIAKLLEVMKRLQALGNTLIVIEHNLDVIKTADWIIDVGPEGGAGGGKIIAEGSPESVAQVPTSHTGRYIQGKLTGS